MRPPPAVLLVLGLALLLAFQYQPDSFQPGAHGFLSAHGLAIAAHLSPDQGFLMLNRMTRSDEEGIQFEAYSGFPIGAFAAIRLVTLPFGSDLAAQIVAARCLMLLFFVAAAVLAYMSICRVTQDRLVAAAATMLAFSSYYCLYYDDMIFNDVPALFGLLLTFHAIVVFGEDGRVTPLALKSCGALFLGFQVYGLLLPFVVLSCVGALIEGRSGRQIVRGPFVAVGLLSLLCGAAILGGNLATERRALNRSFRELPSVQRMEWRLGLAAAEAYREFTPSLVWSGFFKDQLYRIGKMSIPQTLRRFKTVPRLPEGLRPSAARKSPAPPSTGPLAPFPAGSTTGSTARSTEDLSLPVQALGGLALVVAVIGAALTTQRIAALSLVLSGLCWAIPMRHFVAFHEFQSLYYIGIPLALFCVVGKLAQRLAPFGLQALLGAALLILIFSVRDMNEAKAVAAREDTETVTLTADFQRIRDVVGEGRTIFIDGGGQSLGGPGHAVAFYLARNHFQERREGAQFLISALRSDDPGRPSLTPLNSRVFLYGNE